MRCISSHAAELRRALPRLNVGRASLAFVRARILIAAAAWLLGAATATGGCLLAVSLLGDGFGITGSSGQQLTAAAVNKALADAEREPAASRSSSARARPAPRRPRAARPTPTATSTAPPTPASPPASSPSPAQSTTPVGTPLSSQAGTVVATCEPAGAYLISWSPAQGYEVDRVNRGSAAVASVIFETTSREVTMNISCSSGTPVSTTTSGGDE
jgi:hypothetical protein